MVRQKLAAGVAIIAMVAFMAIVSGCTDSPTSNDQAMVEMQAEMSDWAVTSAKIKEAVTLGGGATVDSMRITRVRILISDIKLHRDHEDETQGDRTVKAGPFLIQVDATGAKVFASGSIPPGTYDKVKFECHKLSGSEVSLFLRNPLFADFVTDDRYTMIVEGTVYVNGVEMPFTYRSSMTVNLNFKIEPGITLAAGVTTRLVIVINPGIIFRSGFLQVLDPRDERNHGEIEGSFRGCFHARKR